MVFLTVLVWAFITDMIGPCWFENLMMWDYPKQTRQCDPWPNCGVHEFGQNLYHFCIYVYPNFWSFHRNNPCHQYGILPRKHLKTTPNPLTHWTSSTNQVERSIINLDEFFFVGLSFDSAMAHLNSCWWIDRHKHTTSLMKLETVETTRFCWPPNFAPYFFVNCLRVTPQKSRLVVCPLV